MTQVNLLPTDVRVRQTTRRNVGLVMAAGVAVMGVLFFVFVLQSARLVGEQHKLSQQQAVNGGLQTRITSLSRFQELKQTVASRQALLTSVEVGEIHWSGILRDVSMVIPDNMFLTSLSASAGGAAAGTGSGAVAGGLAGTIQFQGVVGDYPTVAKWLTRLEEVTGWVNPWANSAAKQDTTGQINFTGSVDLSMDATVHGAPQ
jgi:Tfp pilus assembly protein PilN